jgi:hypothetical protein
LPIAAVVVALAVLGSGSAFLWNGYGGAIGVPSIISSKATDAGPAQPSLTDLVRELQKTEQQSAAQIQAAAQLLASQQAEIKNLSAQVAALAAKVDALQALAPAPVQAVKQAAPPVRKKPAPPATNTAGPQPLSPAPVQLAPGADRQ